MLECQSFQTVGNFEKNLKKCYVVDYCKKNNLLPYIDGNSFKVMHIFIEDEDLYSNYIDMLSKQFSTESVEIVYEKELSYMKTYYGKTILSRNDVTFDEVVSSLKQTMSDDEINEFLTKKILKYYNKIKFRNHSKLATIFSAISDYCDLGLMLNYLSEFFDLKNISCKPLSFPVILNPVFQSTSGCNCISSMKFTEKELSLDFEDKIRLLNNLISYFYVDCIMDVDIKQVYEKSFYLPGYKLMKKYEVDALMEYAQMNTELINKFIKHINGDVNGKIKDKNKERK